MIDLDKVERDARYDGVWVLETSTDLATAEVAKAYKSLWRVERAFRTLTSPLERRLFEEEEVDATFGEVLDALQQVQEVRVEVKGIPLQLVTGSSPLARDVFKALGMRPPPRLQKLT